MKFEKPGPKPRTEKIHNMTRIHAIDKPGDLKCVRCGMITGTECFRHYESFRKFEFGAGTGKKGDDKMSAFLCMKCDNIMSKKPTRLGLFVLAVDYELKIYKHSEEWVYLICRTWLL